MIFKKILSRIGRAARDGFSSSFMRHNRNVFARKQSAGATKKKVIIELNAMHSAHIAYSYVANVLASRQDSAIHAYVPHARDGVLQKLSFGFEKAVGAQEFGIYQSFGAVSSFAPSLSAQQSVAADVLFQQTVAQLKSKKDVEDLTIDGVWIGDLVYDSYLMNCKKPTVVLTDPDFLASLRHSLGLFVFWNDLIDAGKVSAVNVSHCVYNQALPLRIGVQKGIPVFQSNLTHIYRLKKDNLFAYNDFFYFRERFAALPDDVKAKGLAEAERRITRRFSGEVGVDMSYSTKSAYGAFKKERLIKESSRKKILIATHCFFDSPHSYGKNLFPDFYEWLDFLGKITLETDYDWYIKTHPDYLAGTMEIINAFILKYPKLTLLPADSSHHQIISEGIDLALTVYGTIGFEYAALGVPVINASVSNPHIAYDFNIHPKSVEQYRQLLMTLDTLQVDIDKSEVYQYYFMARIFNTQNIFFEDYDDVIKGPLGYQSQFTSSIYEKWLKEWTPEKHQRIADAIDAFIASGDFRMDYRHFGRDFDIESIGTDV